MNDNLSKISPSVWKNEDGSVKMVSQALVQVMPMIGLKQITDTNVAEVFLRVRLMEAVIGPLLMTADNTPRAIKLEDIKAHVGLNCPHTNLMSTMDYWRCFSEQLGQITAEKASAAS